MPGVLMGWGRQSRTADRRRRTGIYVWTNDCGETWRIGGAGPGVAAKVYDDASDAGRALARLRDGEVPDA